MSNKRYYWLKLKEDFFEDDTIRFIENQKNGIYYSNFYLKLLLKSLKQDGLLIRYIGEMMLPYDVEALAELTNCDFDTVRSAMDLFEHIGIVKKLDSGELHLTQVEEMIGSETSKAEKMRKLRAKRKQHDDKKLKNGNIVTPQLPDVTKSYTEIDIELEKDKDLDKELDKEKEYSPAEPNDALPYKKIIDYLNNKAEKKYRHTTKKTKELIKARYNEGFELEDFKHVIDIKTKEWKNTNMDTYLRPETLFGTKFEGYLNQKEAANKFNGNSNNYNQPPQNNNIPTEKPVRISLDD